MPGSPQSPFRKFYEEQKRRKDEEERRQKFLAADIAMGVNPSASPWATPQEKADLGPKEFETKLPGWKIPTSAQANTAKDEYRQRAEQAFGTMQTESTSAGGDLIRQYTALKFQMGEAEFDRRLEAIDHIYRSYLTPYEGSGLVWDMMRSPYSLTELSQMVQQAYQPMMSKTPEADMLQSFFLLNGVDPNDPKAVERATAALVAMGGIRNAGERGEARQALVRVDAFGNIRSGDPDPEDDEGWAMETLNSLGRGFAAVGGGAVDVLKWLWSPKPPGEYSEAEYQQFIASRWESYEAGFGWKGGMAPHQNPEYQAYLQAGAARQESGARLRSQREIEADEWKNWARIMGMPEQFDDPVAQEWVYRAELSVRDAVLLALPIKGAVLKPLMRLPGMRQLVGLTTKWVSRAAGNIITKETAAMGAGIGSAATGVARVLEKAGIPAGRGLGSYAAASLTARAVSALPQIGSLAAKAPAIMDIIGGAPLDTLIDAERQHRRQREMDVAVEEYLTEEEPGAPLPSILANDSAYEEFQQVDAMMSELTNPNDVMAMELEIQKQGFAPDLEATGVWTPEWRREIMRASSQLRREAVDYQLALQEMGYAKRWWEITGDMSDPNWQEADTHYKQAMSEAEAFQEKHPKVALFLNAFGIPTSGEARDARWTGLWNYGVLHGIIHLPITGAAQIGAGFNAIISAIELECREANDDAYNDAWRALADYVADKPVTDAQLEGTAWDENSQPWGQNDKAFVEWAFTKGYLREDAAGGDLFNAYKTEVNRLLNPALYRGDIVSLVGNLFHGDEVVLAEWQARHPQITHATNILLNTALGVFGPKVWKTAKETVGLTRVTPRTLEGTISPAYVAELRRTYHYFDEGDAGSTGRRMNGTDAGETLEPLVHKQGGTREMWYESPELDAKVKAVQDALAGPNPEAAIKLALPRMSERSIKALIQRSQRGITKTDIDRIQEQLAMGEQAGTSEFRAERLAKIEEQARAKALKDYEAAIETGTLKRLRGAALKAYIDKIVAKKRLTYLCKVDAEVAEMSSEAGWQRGVIREQLLERQVAHSEVFGRQHLSFEEFKARVDQQWLAGADIFPHLTDPLRAKPSSRLAISLDRSIAGIHSPLGRRFATALVAWAHTAPQFEGTMAAARSADWVADSALAVSGDMRFASLMRTRFLLAKTQAHYDRIARDLSMAANTRFVLQSRNTLRAYMNRVASTGSGRQGPESAFAGAQEAMTETIGDSTRQIKEGENLAAFVDADKRGSQVLPDTVYQRTTLRLYREALFAPFRITGDMNLVVRGLTHMRNVGRTVNLALNTINQPLRQWSVAVGAAVLFQKHALTDSARSILEEGVESVIFRAQHRARVDAVMEELAPAVRDEVLESRVRSNQGDYMFNMGRGQMNQWELQRVFEKREGVARELVAQQTKSDRITQAGEALRRICMGRGLQEWAKALDTPMTVRGKKPVAGKPANYAAGQEAVRAWLATPEGVQFLKDGNHYAMAATEIELRGANNFQNKPVAEVAADLFIERFVKGYWERLNEAMPETMKTVRTMARAEATLDAATLGKTLTENFVKSGENPVLSMPMELTSRWQDLRDPGTYVGWAMTMNKWNRGAVYDQVFADVYDRLQRDMVTLPDGTQRPRVNNERAARAAATVAEIQTGRVHFDLSRMLSIEAKYRHIAWFATKHRLYGTYLLKIAARRPMLAAAALEIAEWMKERNAAEGDDDYGAAGFKFSVGGFPVSLNLGTLFWLTEYAEESGSAQLLEQAGAKLVNALPGPQVGLVEAIVPKQQFDITLARVQPLIQTVARLINAHSQVHDEKTLEAYLDSVDAGTRRDWNRAINKQLALAAFKGEDIDVVEAFNRASASSAISEFWKCFKVIPITVENKAWPQIEKERREFYALKDADARYQYLNEHPALQWSLNLYEDPVKQYHINDAFDRVDAAALLAQQELETALDNGTIMDPKVMGNILQKYNAVWDNLQDSTLPEFNEDFKDFVNATSDDEFIERLGMLFPLIPPEKAALAGHEPNESERDAINARFDEMLQGRLEAVNLVKPDGTVNDSSPLYKSIRMDVDYMRQGALRQAKVDLTYDQETVLRFLQRGGEVGVYKADAFLDLVHDEQYRALIQRGTSGGTTSRGNPWMLSLTTEQKAQMGFNADPESQKTWLLWATQYQRCQEYMAENGITYQSKAGQQVWAEFDRWSEKIAGLYPAWAKEYEFSQMPLYRRLEKFGVGDPTTKASTAAKKEAGVYRDFLSIIEELHTDMDSLGYASLESMQSKELSDYYLAKIQKLANEELDWWRSFVRSFTLSDFGFYWKMAGPYQALWPETDQVPDEVAPDIEIQEASYGER